MPPAKSPIAVLSVAAALPLAPDGTAPDWAMVMPAGRSTGVDGRGPFVLSDPGRVVAQSMGDGRPLPMDYNHQTVFATLNGAPSPAAGWIDRLDVREGALWGHIEWTEAGRMAVASREYRYLSPAFRHDKSGEVQALVSVGLVNMPNLTELPALNSQQFKSGDPMDASEALAAVAAALGLAADAAPDRIAAQCREMVGGKAPPVPAVTGAPDPRQYVPMGAFTELQQQVAAMAAGIAAGAATAAVDEAARAGKVSPALRGWALDYAARDLAGFQAWAQAAPAIVAPGALLAGQPPAAGQGEDPMVLQVCSQLGITVEQYRAASPAGDQKGGAA
ncbi:MAG: hypothetical protein RLZZ501_855 [Pseudomonadota bacterium]